jgi:HK97 family phage prohead protease
VNATTTAALKRLDEVLAAEPQGPTRHERVAALAEQHAADRTPRQGVRHKQVATVEPEQKLTGEFVALISDWQPDRQRERFARTAFDKALAKLRAAGKPTPVLFGHDQQTFGGVIGAVAADQFWTDSEGLWARGWLDVTSEVGSKLHEMLRRQVLTWSIGYIPKRTRRGRDGVGVVEEVDELVELSAVPVAANSRTRTVAAKAAREAPSLAELADHAASLDLEPHDPELERIRVATRQQMEALLASVGEEGATAAKHWKDEVPSPVEVQRWLDSETLSVPLSNLGALRRVEDDTGALPSHDLNGSSSLEDRAEEKALGERPVQLATFDL